MGESVKGFIDAIKEEPIKVGICVDKASKIRRNKWHHS